MVPSFYNYSTATMTIYNPFKHAFEKVTKENVDELASTILDEMEGDDRFMGPGRRNDDTVNLLICCRITGKDPDEFVKGVLEDEDCESYRAYIYHEERIEPYLDGWCPAGKEEQGYNYVIGTVNVEKAHRVFFGKENW